MASTRNNAFLLSQWLKETYKGEFTEEQFRNEVVRFLGFRSDRAKREYLQYCLEYEQIRQVESGNFVATPCRPLTPRQKLAKLRGKEID